jgi:hypothetical protein
MSNFTPGPWKWENDDGNWRLRALCDIEKNGTCPNFDGNDPIVDDGSAGGEYSQTIDPTTSPNAPLIAKAPDLYARLEDISAAFDFMMGHPETHSLRLEILLRGIPNLLAEARGEQPA